MRVKKLQRGYTAYLSDHEYAILLRMADRFNIDEEWKDMPSGQRRSWGRRIRRGAFLRVDEDTRKW